MKSIIFDFELRDRAKEASAPTHFRRPFFTEHERECMSQQLISDVSPAATAEALRLLDDDIEAMLVEGMRDIDYTRGPFSAFTAKGQEGENEPLQFDLTQQSIGHVSESVSNLARQTQVLESQVDEMDLEQGQNASVVPLWHQCAPATVSEQEDDVTFQAAAEHIDVDEEVNPNYRLPGERLPKIAADMGGPFCDGVVLSTAFASGGTLAHAQAIFENNFWQTSLAAGQHFFDSAELPFVQNDFYTAAVGVPTANPIFMNTQQNPLLIQAIPLLKHYGSSVIASMSPFRHENTPWHIMFLAQLKTCLATLTLRENLDGAGMTTFYGSLAISALSLGMTSESQMWLDHATRYQRQAGMYARAVLTRPFIELDAEEYKSALIALLTMVQMSLFSGKRDQTEEFLLETEKLVRLRGLSKKKSRKTRLLHHCYVHMRLFHESTFVPLGYIESSHRREIRHAVESSGVSGSSDNLSFRLLLWNDLFHEMTVMKDQIEGENDLHIARPGLFPSTMYPEIFGIPEPFFFYWSQIIRLGNEKDIAEHNSEPTSLGDFSKRAKAIERGVNQLQSKTLIRQQDDSLVLTSLLDGMQSALQIYFYRRIYDVSSSILQPLVLSVHNWLFEYDQANPDYLHGSFGLMWPAFIAACEADGTELQNSFRQWFRNAKQRSGLGCISENANFVEKVWEVRRGDDKDNVSWLDVIGQSRAVSADAGCFMVP